MPFGLSVSVVLVVGLAAFLLGVSKGGLGGGIGPAITVLVALVLPSSRAIGLLLPMLMVGDVIAVWAHRRDWDRALVVRLLPGATFGVILASFFLGQVSDRALEVFLALFSLVFVAYQLATPHLGAARLRAGTGLGVAAGVASGVTSTVAHAGGPPVTVYLLARRTPPVQFVATIAVLFWVVNWLKVPGYLAAGLFDADLLLRVAPLALLILPGVLVGRVLVHRISPRHFEYVILLLLSVGAIYLLAA